MKLTLAKINEAVFGTTVDSILSDFNKKLESLDYLIESKIFLVESYTERIAELETARSVAEDEIVRATKVSAKISALINTQE